MMNDKKQNQYIVVYNNGYMRAYNRLSALTHELMDVGIIKFVIDTNDITYLNNKGEWEKIGTTDI